MVETTGDVFACGEIVDKRVDKDDVRPRDPGRRPVDRAGRRAQLLPLHLSSPRTSGVRLTGSASRLGRGPPRALFMMIIGVIPKVGAIVAAIPYPVLGGCGLRAVRTRSR
jgi:xanthine/uracil permease